MDDLLGEDTIVALATPPGASLVGIVRLSGKKALSICERLFLPEARGTIARPEVYSALVGKLRLNQMLVPASLYLMPAPYSYTREDVAEIHLPGAPVLLSLAVEECLKLGARLATRGEFTRRALLAGRIDLNQAEAVLKIVQAEDADASRLAMHELEGGFSRCIEDLSDKVLECVVELEAAIDFSDQDIEPVERRKLADHLTALQRELASLAEEQRKSGVHSLLPRAAICGVPNVGKSSLFNVLLGAEKAIVTAIPGTTRDVLEGELELDGLKLMLLDSAGIAPAKSGLEEAIIQHTLAMAEEADLILFALDSSQSLSPADEKLYAKLGDKPTIVILTKADLPPRLEAAEVEERLGIEEIVPTSAKAGTGIEELKAALREALSSGRVERRASRFLLSLRQKEALRQSGEHVSYGLDALSEGLGEEFAALDLREALDALGTVSGNVTSEDVLDEIFSRFCIGK